MATRRVAHPRIVLVIAAVAAMTGCLYGPPYDQLLTGDEELLDYARERFGDATDRVAMAVIDGDEVRTAFVSADASTMFELGTGTRLLTGLLLAESIERGEVALDDPVGDYLPLGDSPAASLTLRALATQHSGLPDGGSAGTGWRDPRVTDEPDTANGASDSEGPPERAISLDELLDLVETMAVNDPAYFEFNDVQAALVGNALAAAADRDFAELLSERVLDPLGMDDAVLVEEIEDVPDALAPPKNSSGSGDPVAPGAYAPAVGLVVTIDDLVALAGGVISGEFADSAALEPIAETPWAHEGVGYFWHRDHRPEGDLTSFFGWSSGYCVAMLVYADDGRAAMLLRNSGDTYPWDEAFEVLSGMEG